MLPSAPAVIASLFLVLFLLERLYPLRKTKRSRLAKRILVNIVLSALALFVASWSVKPLAEYSMTWASGGQIGLLYQFELPLWLEAAIGFLLMDLSFYYWHRLNHSIPLLWRFHLAHHIDPELDCTTSFRFHFVEVAYSCVFRVAQILIIGVSPALYLAYEMIFQASTLLHHSNIRLPIIFERFLNLFIVTPRMHGIHHSQVKEHTNANYSVIFRWWDSMHKTLKLDVPQESIKIGIHGYNQIKDNHPVNVLRIPFLKQRAYWRKKDG
jgi:sterol desaturase/sphingolipid hydroxylase (fatty acid hydroxylase superfamily)